MGEGESSSQQPENGKSLVYLVHIQKWDFGFNVLILRHQTLYLHEAAK